MAPRVVPGHDSSDSVSTELVPIHDGFGLISHYASRMASTAELRKREKDRLMPAEPVKFGRLARAQETNKRPFERLPAQRTRPVNPVHLLHVIAGHSPTPEPI